MEKINVNQQEKKEKDLQIKRTFVNEEEGSVHVIMNDKIFFDINTRDLICGYAVEKYKNLNFPGYIRCDHISDDGKVAEYIFFYK